jgi:RecA/RadA recombinase
MRSKITTQTTPTLPSLDPESYLLDADNATGPLQTLVLDHLLLNDGTAYWVDAAGHARTDALTRLAPSTRLLDRMQVARGVTAYQHAALIDRVTELLTPETSLVVAPAIDAMYRDDDSHGVDAERLLRDAVSTLTDCCRASDTPLVVTCQRRDELTAPVARHVDETIRCETTQFGPRFVGDGFETLVYPLGDGTVQTTLAFWEHVLARRATVTSTDRREVLARGSN